MEARRTFADTNYSPSRQRAELSYAGFGVSVGVIGQFGEALMVSAMARSDGRVSLDRDSTEIAKVDLPITVGGAARLRITPKLHVGGQALYRNWSTANDDLVALGGTGAANTLEASGGIEFTPDPRRPFKRPDPARLPLRRAAVSAHRRRVRERVRREPGQRPQLRRPTER